MIYLNLFLSFLKVGAVSFGGGYGMISMIRDDCLSNGWLSEGELLNFIAVAESTPGPIAVNMATFVGSSQGGILGAFLATLGVVLPSFIIILLVASVFSRLLKYAGVRATLGGIKPAIVALILGTGTTMLLSLLFGIKSFGSSLSAEPMGIVIFVTLAALSFGHAKIRKKPISPILLIVFSGILGVILF